MKYQLADLVNGPFGDVYATEDEAGVALAAAIQEGKAQNMADSGGETENGSDGTAVEEFFSIVEIRSAEDYIGGRFTSTPEDQFRADGVEVECYDDDGEYTYFEFADGTRCKVDADGEIKAV